MSYLKLSGGDIIGPGYQAGQTAGMTYDNKSGKSTGGTSAPTGSSVLSFLTQASDAVKSITDKWGVTSGSKPSESETLVVSPKPVGGGLGIPTWALLLGVGAVGYVIWKRRKKG